MTAFARQLQDRALDPAGRRWLFIPYDQLSAEIGPLSREDPDELGIILIESPWKARRRPYHKQKLALVLSNLRHFAIEQADRGVAVRHVVAQTPYREALRPLIDELGPIRVMEPAERELRVDLQPLVDEGALEVRPHEGWLTADEDFRASQNGGPPWRMDAFYRHVRQRTGILMNGDAPAGGKYSFDPENRESWSGEPPAPEPPEFPLDPIKEEVCELVARRYGHHPGELTPDALPGTLQDAETLWARAKQECMEHFGPYEDAMSRSSSGLFHTRLSALLNLHRLLPERVVREVAELDVPLASREGFVRQVLGWREFVHHVHVATDGLRQLPGPPVATLAAPGDGGYESWAGKPWSGSEAEELDGGAAPSLLGSAVPLPPAFWGTRSGLDCLDRVVSDVWRESWSHHITRLMVLSNLAMLLDVEPRALTDWFWIAYTDAYDWVVEPNVLGMGTFATGDLMTGKPYISGAAYIRRMSDYCGGCRFDPRSDCPFTSLYWAYLGRHREALEGYPRMRLPLANLEKRGSERRLQDERVYDWARAALGQGEILTPEGIPGPAS